MSDKIDKKWREKVIELYQTPRFKGKPLSLAGHVGRSWKSVVAVLIEENLANPEDYSFSDVGFSNWG